MNNKKAISVFALIIFLISILCTGVFAVTQEDVDSAYNVWQSQLTYVNGLEEDLNNAQAVVIEKQSEYDTAKAAADANQEDTSLADAADMAYEALRQANDTVSIKSNLLESERGNCALFEEEYQRLLNELNGASTDESTSSESSESSESYESSESSESFEEEIEQEPTDNNTGEIYYPVSSTISMIYPEHVTKPSSSSKNESTVSDFGNDTSSDTQSKAPAAAASTSGNNTMGKRLLILGVVLLVLAAGGIGVFVYTMFILPAKKGKKQKSPSRKPAYASGYGDFDDFDDNEDDEEVNYSDISYFDNPDSKRTSGRNPDLGRQSYRMDDDYTDISGYTDINRNNPPRR